MAAPSIFESTELRLVRRRGWLLASAASAPLLALAVPRLHRALDEQPRRRRAPRRRAPGHARHPRDGRRLFRVVEDPASGSADRAAAAVALGSDLDDAGRARLRSAAAGVAGPRLRAALETAASQAEQSALEAALAEVEQEEATQRAERAYR
jgi:hypothetical protein